MSRLNVNQIYTRTGTGSPAIREMPAFRALATVNQAVTNSTVTQVNLPNVMFDTNNWFSTSTYRYTPQISGYYFFNGMVAGGGTSMTTVVAYIQKNGSYYTLRTSRAATNTAQYITVSAFVYLNGSTDYVSLSGFVAASSGTTFYVSPDNESWATSTFEGFLVRPD